MDEENNNNENQKTLKDYLKGFGKGAIKAIKAIKSVKWGLPLLCGLLLILLAAGLINLVPYMITGQYTKLFGGGSTTVDIYGNSDSNLSNIVRINPTTGAFELTDNNFSETILKQLEEQKVSTEAFGLTKVIEDAKFKNLVDKYIKAEVMTSLPKTNKRSDLDGIIILKRILVDLGGDDNHKAASKTREIELKYVAYNEFTSIVAKGDIDEASKYFTLDPLTFELCIAREKGYEVLLDKDGNPIGGWDTDGASGKEITIDRFKYQNYVQDFVVPLNFFISLHAIAQDNEFMEAVVDMVLGTAEEEPIVLTYIEAKGTYDEIITFTGEEQIVTTTKFNNESTNSVIMPDNPTKTSTSTDIINNDNVEEMCELEEEEEIEYFEKHKYACSGSLYVTKANTWLKNSEKILGSTNPAPVSEKIKENVIGSEGEFKHIGGSSYRIEDKFVTTTTYQWLVKETSYYSDNKDIMEIDTESEIKVDDFVDLIRRYPNVENRLTTAPSNLFYLLQQNENTQEFEQIMRYVLYKLDDIDYGVTEADLELIFGYSMTRDGKITRLKDYLAQFIYNEEGPPMSEDGQYYKVQVDAEGHAKVGLANIAVEQYLNIQGNVIHNGTKIEVENVAEYVDKVLSPNSKDIDLYIEKELVDIVTDKASETTYSRIEDFQLSGLGLSRQQIYALTAIYQDLGGLPEINGRTFKDVYEAGMSGNEKNSWQHNKYIWDNWWSKVGGKSEQAIINRDIQFETYTKGIFDISVSDAGDVYSRKRYIYYTSAQLSELGVAAQLPTRNTAEEEDIFEYENNSGVFERVNGKYITGYYTSTLGRTFTIIDQSKIGYEDRPYWRLNNKEDGPGWHGRCNRAACTIVASGYSDEDANSLITTMNMHYDANIPTNESGYWKKYGLVLETITGKQSVEAYTEKVRNQLLKGGYALVWMDGANYLGKTPPIRNYTGSPNGAARHWVAIIDYRIHDGQEQIVVADLDGAYWRDIGEFQFGVDQLVLIGEE